MTQNFECDIKIKKQKTRKKKNWMATVEGITQLMEKIQSTGDAESEQALNALIVPPEGIFILFEILKTNEKEVIRMFTSICIYSRLFRMTEEIPDEIIEQIKALLIEALENEPLINVRYQIAFVAASLFRRGLHDKEGEPVWGELIEYGFALLQNPERVETALYLWKSIQANPNIFTEKSSFVQICQFALENLANENGEVRTQAASFIEYAVWTFADMEIDPSAVQQALFEGTHRSYYELGAENEAYNEAHSFTLAAIEAFLSNFLTDAPSIVEFFVGAMQDESLTYRFRLEAAYAVSKLYVQVLDGQDPEKLQEILSIAISTTVFLASEEFENKNYEMLSELIWAIPFVFDDDLPLKIVLQTLEEFKEDLTDEARCIGLFLIDSIVEGSREFIAQALPQLAETINGFGDSEDEFIINSTCQLYIEMIKNIPELIPIIVDDILEYLSSNFPHEGTVTGIITLLGTIKKRPSKLDDVLSSFITELQESDQSDYQETMLYCIGACLSFPEQPNEEMFAQLAPGLLQMAQSSDELIPSVLHVFSKLVFISPSSTVSDIETITQLAIEAMSTENLVQIENALSLLDALISYLPVAVQPYLENITHVIWELKESNPIGPSQHGQNGEQSDDELLGVHSEMLHCIGHLVQNYPEEMTPLAEEILTILKANVDEGSCRPIPATEACLYACEGFEAMGAETEITLLDIANDITRFLTHQGDKPIINAYYNFTAQLIKTSPEIMEAEKGKYFVPRIMNGLGGEIYDFLPFELASSLDPIILPSFFSNFFALLRTPSSQLEEIYTVFSDGVSPYLDSYTHHIAALSILGMSIIVKQTEDKEELYRNTFVNAVACFNKNFSPISKEAVLSAFTNLFVTEKELLCQYFSAEPPMLVETFAKLVGEYLNRSKSFEEVSIALISFFGTILYGFEVDGIAPELLAKIVERMPPPVDTMHIAYQAPFMCYGAQRWAEIFGPKFDTFAVRALASLNFYIQKMPTECIQLFLEHVQALDDEAQLAQLSGNQSLFLRLKRNIAALTSQ